MTKFVETDACEDDFHDAIGYVEEWIKKPGRTVTMLAQLMCVSARSFDGPEAPHVLIESIKEDIRAEAN